MMKTKSADNDNSSTEREKYVGFCVAQKKRSIKSKKSFNYNRI